MIGIDTTFLVDLEISDSPRHNGAVALFEKWRREKHSELAIYNQTFLEFQHVITDSFKSLIKYRELSKKRRDFSGKCGFYREYSVKALQNMK